MEYTPNFLNEKIYSLACQEINKRYSGTFKPNSIEHHISGHLGCDFAKHANDVIDYYLPKEARILDLGSGFGSFLLEALNREREITGVEICHADCAIARERLRHFFPNKDAQQVFRAGSVFDQNFSEESFDAITLWNVLEHLTDYKSVLSFLKTLLKPEGSLYIICPNYFAFRNEAHYQLPWSPFMTRRKFISQIKAAGLNPKFFEEEIFPIRNTDLISFLWKENFTLYDRLNENRILESRLWRKGKISQIIKFINPFKPSIELAARKGSA